MTAAILKRRITAIQRTASMKSTIIRVVGVTSGFQGHEAECHINHNDKIASGAMINQRVL
jgi:hypothetical protein